jgi:hypothetical protein
MNGRVGVPLLPAADLSSTSSWCVKTVACAEIAPRRCQIVHGRSPRGNPICLDCPLGHWAMQAACPGSAGGKRNRETLIGIPCRTTSGPLVDWNTFEVMAVGGMGACPSCKESDHTKAGS